MLSYEVILLTQPQILWNFAYKNWITSKMLLIEGPEELRDEKRLTYTRRYNLFTGTLIFLSLVFGFWLSYEDFYLEGINQKNLSWKYFTSNLALTDSTSSIIILLSLRNFNKASKL